MAGFGTASGFHRNRAANCAEQTEKTMVSAAVPRDFLILVKVIAG